MWIPPAGEPAGTLTSAPGDRTLPPMDTLKILLGATVALLIGALAMSLKGYKREMQTVPAEEVAVLKQRIAEMEADMRRNDELRLEKQRIQLQEEVRQPSAQEQTAMEERVRELEAIAADAQRRAEEATEDAERAEDEAVWLNGRELENRNKAARRVRVINDAMVIAVIQEWVNDPNLGPFAILDIQHPENAQPGTVLAIRRNGGVLGKLQIGDISIEGAIANPLSTFDEKQPQVGDELILDEVLKLAN